MHLALLALFTLPADAGKLAEGFRSVTWGADANTPPEEGCVLGAPEDGLVIWDCSGATIGGISVKLSWIAHQTLGVYGATLTAEGYDNCTNLLAVIESAYGKGTYQHSFDHGAMADRTWRDGHGGGSWSWNKYRVACSLSTYNLAIHQERKNLAAAAAIEQGAGDL